MEDDRHEEPAPAPSPASAREPLRDDGEPSLVRVVPRGNVAAATRRTVWRRVRRSFSERIGVPSAKLVERLSKRENTAAAPDAVSQAADDVPAESAAPKRPGILAADSMVEAAFKTLHFHFARMLAHEPARARATTLRTSTT